MKPDKGILSRQVSCMHYSSISKSISNRTTKDASISTLGFDFISEYESSKRNLL